jgi:hypothetical protein
MLPAEKHLIFLWKTLNIQVIGREGFWEQEVGHIIIGKSGE